MSFLQINAKEKCVSMLDNTFSLLSVLFSDRFGGLFFVSTETSSSRAMAWNSSTTIRAYSLLSTTIPHTSTEKTLRQILSLYLTIPVQLW